ncbi:uncharacterized protein B0P05DRAFT_563637 [Gilbertella persicaria]|uniref:Uncharacterized protein n=1 Tax=Rhizopus stolonifer TaxID=4846 RepID=A0A367KR33_RHIST|nr:uncharacterized protein B0P05DRAFT_563637 [Gilbertella persicaria]KAI8049422.1 hypothetical protein B0P05DRAFT_563637 [Gilbertella persicaria]RCI04649.1 hypothetical protein CU098_013213 [Rhizopus stolonifer]
MEVKETFEYFALLEQQFWRKLDRNTLDEVTFRGELKPEDMLLYGEFGFTLLGLKPALLIEFCDEKVNLLYLQTVVEPVLFAAKTKTLHYHIIQHVMTPESNLHGNIFVYHTAVTRLKELSFIMNVSSQDKDCEVSDKDMATILDYPGRLPSHEQEIPTLHTVIYFHDRPNHKGMIALTSFAIQVDEKENTLVHFNRYKSICKEKLQIDLKILIQ